MKVLFYATSNNPLVHALARTFKEEFDSENILITSKKIDHKKEQFPNDPFFDKFIKLNVSGLGRINRKRYFFNLIKNFFILHSKIKRIKPDIIVINASLDPTPEILALPHLLSRRKILFFPYDLMLIHPNMDIAVIISKFFQRIYCLKATGIIHKGSRNDFKYAGIQDKVKKKVYLMREFADKEMFLPYSPEEKISNKDHQIHLVYLGGLSVHSKGIYKSNLALFREIASQKVHVHIYSPQATEAAKKLRQISKRNKYFHYEGFLPHKKLTHELLKYDFGLLLFKYSQQRYKQIIEGAFGTKLFDYLSAVLPVIVSDELKTQKELIVRNNFGFSIKYDKATQLKDIIKKKKKDYDGYVQSILKNREKYADKSKLKKFIKAVLIDS